MQGRTVHEGLGTVEIFNRRQGLKVSTVVDIVAILGLLAGLLNLFGAMLSLRET